MLHYVFAKMEMAEERGLGVKSVRNSATQNGLPLPKYSWEAPYLVLTLYRNPGSAVNTLSESLFQNLIPEERKGWPFLAARSDTTQSHYARHLGITARTAQRHLTHFVKLGLLRRLGHGPATEYKVIN